MGLCSWMYARKKDCEGLLASVHINMYNLPSLLLFGAIVLGQ